MTRVKRPSIQFYPGDWLRDTALRSVSPAARGVWMDLMCLMHDGDPYGHLAVNGRPLPEDRMAGMVGLTPEAFRPLLGELLDAGIPGRSPDGVLYSRRMVKDHQIRAVRSAAGKVGAAVLHGRQEVTPFVMADRQQMVASADANAIAVAREGGVGETAVPTADYLTACCVALNESLAVRTDLGGAFALVAAVTQYSPDGRPVVSWEADGIPLATAVGVIRDRTARYRVTPRSRQPHSLRYFDNAVREAHERATQPAAVPTAGARPFKKAPRLV